MNIRWIQQALVIGLLATAQAVVAAGPRNFSLSADEWARPRSGQRLTAFPALRDLAAVWGTVADGAVIEIRYPGGDEGSLWAAELSDWLVSLGYASDDIRLAPGSARADRIELIIVEPQH